MSEGADRDDLVRWWSESARFASRIAHDFDNVLTGVSGFTELAQMQLPPEHAAHAYLADVLRAAARGIEFANRLHVLQRCGIPKPTPTDPRAALDRIQEFVDAQIKPRVEITFKVPSDPPKVCIESEPLYLALLQFSVNAIEACGKSGTIVVEAASISLNDDETKDLNGVVRPGRYLEIRISDHGTGIPPETRSRLLVEPLFTTKPRHWGLGLAIAFRVLSAHGGGFALEPAVPHGTVARVVVPIA